MPRKKLRSDVIVQPLVEATSLGDRLRALRDEKEVSNADLAKAMGIDESTLGQILAGDIERPPDDRLRGAARVLGVSFESLRNLIPGRLREAMEGARWSVKVIESGISKNRNEYPPAVLQSAAPKFDGVAVFAVSDKEHLAGGSRDVTRMTGRIMEPEYIQTNSGGEIRATLQIIHPEGEIGQWLVSAFQRGMSDMFGLSINAVGRSKLINGIKRTVSIDKVNSVDLVVSPSAGGRIISLIEANAMSGANPNTNIDTPERRERLSEARAEISESKLPKKSRKRLKKQLENSIDISEGAVTRLVESERGYIAAMNSGHPGAAVVGLGAASRVSLIEAREDRIPKMLDALLDPKDSSVTSLKEAYIDITGDRKVTGEMRNVDGIHLREAIVTGTGAGAGVFAQVFGDSIARRMQAMYRNMGIYDWYRQVCTEVPAADFREQKRPRWGGYGDLPTVAQGGAYAALTSPSDDEELYTVEKRGGTETLSIESIKNDDVGVIMSLPRKLAQAAKRTLSGHIAALFTANSGAGSTLNSDSLALFHANHSNRGTAALAASTVAAGRLAMVKQAELSSGKQIGIPPKTLLVPWDLQQAAYDLFRLGTNNEKDFVQSLQYQVVPVPEWTDENDWVLVADPMDMETIEIGYLDGEMEPEIFVQNSESYGSMFDNDQWTFKIRHIYGATVMDYRAFYKALVT